jgi:hypothetical protein
MRIFKNPWFARFAVKEGITDAELRDMVRQLEAGQIGAGLGGGVYKVRMARPGTGKSGGYRVILFFRSRDRTFFQYGFSKSKRDNISDKELSGYKRTAKSLFAVDDKGLNTLAANGDYIEI